MYFLSTKKYIYNIPMELTDYDNPQYKPGMYPKHMQYLINGYQLSLLTPCN